MLFCLYCCFGFRICLPSFASLIFIDFKTLISIFYLSTFSLFFFFSFFFTFFPLYWLTKVDGEVGNFGPTFVFPFFIFFLCIIFIYETFSSPCQFAKDLYTCKNVANYGAMFVVFLFLRFPFVFGVVSLFFSMFALVRFISTINLISWDYFLVLYVFFMFTNLGFIFSVLGYETFI